jgi:hypothetical protein
MEEKSTVVLEVSRKILTHQKRNWHGLPHGQLHVFQFVENQYPATFFSVMCKKSNSDSM